MGRHTQSIPIVKPDHDRVILILASQVDALRCEQLAGFVRTDDEVQNDIQEIIDDAWQEVRADE
jgi:hypothetical protein